MLQLTKAHPRYPKYKPTNIDWIGDIPDGWEGWNIRWGAQVYSGWTPEKEKLTYWENGTIPWINSGMVNAGFITEPSALITEEAFENSSAKWISEWSLVMALAWQGKTKWMVAQLWIRTTCNQSMAAIVPRSPKMSRYLFWWLTSNYQNIRNMWGWDNRDWLNLEMVKSIRFPIPAASEMGNIISYLDEKTALIDEAIAKKQHQIELLSEHRTALINNAITKGLDPNAEMKDSGTPWIGMIPKGWEVKKMKYVVSNKNQKTAFSGNMFSIAMENIESWTGKYLSTEGEKVFETDMNSFEKGDVLFGKLRPYLAKAYKAESDGLCVGEFLVLRPSDKITQDFLFYRTISSDFITQVNNSTFGAKMPRADWGFIGNLAIGIPSIEEQKKIVDFLEKEITYIEAMKEKIQHSIDLLQEYKTSLISHVVSGKIKV
jgi:type I restriction enzyme, S subunit